MDRWPPYGGGREGRFDCIYIYVCVCVCDCRINGSQNMYEKKE